MQHEVPTRFESHAPRFRPLRWIPCVAAWALSPTPLALAQDGGDLAGVGDTFDAAELIPSAAAGLPPILPGQEPGARERGAVSPVPPPADAAREWFGHADWWTWSRATGDWGGARTAAEDAGFELNGSVITEWSRVFSGGTDNASAFRFLLDLNLTVDLEKLIDLKGGSVFADFQNADTGMGALVHGGFQPYSNIAIDGSITQLSQLWYEQWLFDDVLRVKVGKVDANTEFAYIPAAGGFINASAGFTPTIFALPTYPNPSTSINVFLYPTETWYVGFGAYDGAATIDGVPTGSRGPSTFFSDDLSDDWFLIAESGVTIGEAGFLRDLRVAAGGWWLVGDVPNFDGGTDDGTGGVYALAESRVWAPDGVDFGNDEDTRGLWAFLQAGWSDPNVALAAQQYGGGCSLTGTFPGRDDDSTGIYASYVVFGDDPTSGLGDAEFSLEIFYDIAITPFLHLKPDLQWFHDPSGDGSTDDALVGTLRLTITF
ncbi:MAG: carbohydrate porin [Planctomycetaceae bacterium]|nr:carbohydrate porin [Planctomycetaceae bacterium]